MGLWLDGILTSSAQIPTELGLLASLGKCYLLQCLPLYPISISAPAHLVLLMNTHPISSSLIS